MRPSTAGSMERQSRRVPTAAPSRCIDWIRGSSSLRVASDSRGRGHYPRTQAEADEHYSVQIGSHDCVARTAPVIEARVLATCQGLLARPAPVKTAPMGPSSLPGFFAAWAARAAADFIVSGTAVGATSEVSDLSSFSTQVRRYTVASGSRFSNDSLPFPPTGGALREEAVGEDHRRLVSVRHLFEAERLVGANVGIRHAGSGRPTQAHASGGHHCGSPSHPVAAHCERSTAEKGQSMAGGGCAAQAHVPRRSRRQSPGRRRRRGGRRRRRRQPPPPRSRSTSEH